MSVRRNRLSYKQFSIRESQRLLRALTGREHALLAGRGASGIYAALRALGLHDQYVLIPANTCYIVLWAVLRSGNKPLLVDVDAATGNWAVEELSDFSSQLSAEGKQSGIQSEIKAVIPCHMYGIGAPIAAICDWARANGIYVIEDAALALGATVDGRSAGAWGDVSIFSFGLGKIADNQVGGAVMTDDANLADEIGQVLPELLQWDDRLMGLTNQWNAIYWATHQYETDNPNLPTLYPKLYELYGELTAYQLAADWDDLPGMLRELPKNLEHRERLAERYDELLRGLPIRTFPRPTGSVLWRYPLLVAPEYRNDLLGYLWENGIHDATRWYPSLRYMAAELAPEVTQPPTPNADLLGESIINLRLDLGLDEQYVERTARLIRQYFDEMMNSPESKS